MSEEPLTPTSDDSKPILDVETCIALHNRIVHYGIERMRAYGVTDIIPVRGWFYYWRDQKNVERFREFLSDELVEFLDGIDIVDAEKLAFLPQLLSVARPSEMAEDDEDIFFDNFLDEGFNCILLYPSPGFSNGEEERGLVINLNDHAVSFFDDYYETIRERDNTWAWIPFQDALTYYWGLVEAGKFIIGQDPDNSDIPGWLIADYCEADLETTLEAWDTFCSMISARIPQEESEERPSLIGWFEPAQLDEAHVQGFAREFLLKARRPPVRFVAPGLTIMDSNLLRHAGETNESVLERDFCEEVRYLLFPMARPTVPGVPPSDTSLQDSIGLFLRPAKYLPRQRYGDGTEFILPWAAGGIFTHSICPVMKDHPVRLEMIIRKWIHLLDDGTWTVGLDGIEGGIEYWERFKELDERKKLDLPHECASTAI